MFPKQIHFCLHFSPIKFSEFIIVFSIKLTIVSTILFKFKIKHGLSIRFYEYAYLSLILLVYFTLLYTRIFVPI